MDDILRLLKRKDKHYLGGGNRLLWAPSFPLFPDVPGFWDTGHYYNYELHPLFTWTLLDDGGAEIPLTFLSRRWDPSALTLTYTGVLEHGVLTVTEKKCILPNDLAVSELTLRLRGMRHGRVHLVAWTAQESRPSKGETWITDPQYRDGTIQFFKHVQPTSRPPMNIGLVLGLSKTPRSYALQLSEGDIPLPRWRFSPMFEKVDGGRLPNSVQLNGISTEGIIFAALQCDIQLTARKPARATVGLATGPSLEEARMNFRTVMRQESPAAFSILSWNDYFSGLPRFSCSDPFLNRYYWYRWYGLRLNSIAGGEGNYDYPVVCEGIGYFRAPISYSAPCHILENRWRHDPDLARGSFLTFIDNQRHDGGFRGYIDVNHYRQEMFYHANWGNALTQLHTVHPSATFLRQTYEALSRYARYFDKERDEEVSGLYDIDNHYETGQEYMRRYMAVNSEADRETWGDVFRLKGVDVTVYIYELKRALAVAARELGKDGEAELWEIEADKIRQAVRGLMWDPAKEMFFDVNPADGKRTMVKAATCFYPYSTDIVSAEHLTGLKHHLLNPSEFWSRHPAPSSSLDDEMFCDEPEWKGKRMNCPWNGRVWPMTNSHLAEVLGRSAIRFQDPLLRRKTAEFIHKFIRMMFFDGNPERPNCFEHYNPFTGKASEYRGIDDYQHSWVVDIIITYVCGIRPTSDGVVIDPFPFQLASAHIEDVIIRGRRITVDITGQKFAVHVDGVRHSVNRMGRSVFVKLT